jgi:hypothetical protein
MQVIGEEAFRAARRDLGPIPSDSHTPALAGWLSSISLSRSAIASSRAARAFNATKNNISQAICQSRGA